MIQEFQALVAKVGKKILEHNLPTRCVLLKRWLRFRPLFMYFTYPWFYVVCFSIFYSVGCYDVLISFQGIIKWSFLSCFCLSPTCCIKAVQHLPLTVTNHLHIGPFHMYFYWYIYCVCIVFYTVHWFGGMGIVFWVVYLMYFIHLCIDFM